MGPKKKEKVPSQKDPEVDPKEVVTELQKEFFIFQLAEIERKLERLDARGEELKGEMTQLEEKIEEVKKERGAVIAELEQTLVLKEQQKVEKRETMLELSEEIKMSTEKHKKHIQALEQKFNDMVAEMTAQIEALDAEVKILDDHKQNKEMYNGQLEGLEREMEEAEMQHQRDLFYIQAKSEQVKTTVKKELQQRLLNLSIEFQQTSQKKIGRSCHRVSQENKAIENALMLMKEEILEYQQRCVDSEKYVAVFKKEQDLKQQDRDKGLARTVIQLSVIKTLMRECSKLMEMLKAFVTVDMENRLLEKKHKGVSREIERKENAIENVKLQIQEKIEQSNAMSETSRYLRKSSRKLVVLTRNALQIAEEAMAVRLIPMGGMEEERYMTNEAKIRTFKKRRDSVFSKKGRILQYLFDFLAMGQTTEEERNMLRGSTESLNIDEINYSSVYGKGFGLGEEGESKEGGSLVSGEEERKKGPVFFTSEVSLPRSLSALVVAGQRESESESYVGEFEGESGEEEEEVVGKMAMPLDFDGEGQFELLGEEESEEEGERVEGEKEGGEERKEE